MSNPTMARPITADHRVLEHASRNVSPESAKTGGSMTIATGVAFLTYTPAGESGQTRRVELAVL